MKVKKNMSGLERVTKSLSTYVGTILAIAGVVVALLNIWVLSKLYPLNESIAVLVTRVNANDKEHAVFTESLVTISRRVDFLYYKFGGQ